MILISPHQRIREHIPNNAYDQILCYACGQEFIRAATESLKSLTDNPNFCSPSAGGAALFNVAGCEWRCRCGNKAVYGFDWGYLP